MEARPVHVADSESLKSVQLVAFFLTVSEGVKTSVFRQRGRAMWAGPSHGPLGEAQGRGLSGPGTGWCEYLLGLWGSGTGPSGLAPGPGEAGAGAATLSVSA